MGAIIALLGRDENLSFRLLMEWPTTTSHTFVLIYGER
jgi:hypothetical protein